MNIEQLVNSSLESGIRPIELKFAFVCKNGEVAAYRGETTIYSMLCGTLTERDYADVIEFSEAGEQLFLRNVVTAALFVKKLTADGKTVDWASVKCPTAFLLGGKGAAKLHNVLKEHGLTNLTKKLCIEIGLEAMTDYADEAKDTIIDLKSKGIKVMVTCGDKKDFPFLMLPNVKADYLYVEDCGKDEVNAAVAKLVCSLGANVVLGKATEKDILGSGGDVEYVISGSEAVAEDFADFGGNEYAQ